MEQETLTQESVQTTEKISLYKRISAFVDKHYTIFYAAIITIFIYFLASFVFGVYPFGNKYTAASYDLSAQICPFIEHVFDVFQGKSTLFYSYAIAGGADVMGTFLYFFISPFSFLFLIFGDGMVAHTSSIVIGLKLATIAVAGTWFAKKLFHNIPDYLCIAVGVVYAYCGYTFVSNTYINWMDFLIYLPFAIAAFKRFVETGKFWVFSIMMACCIYTCFSIACFSMFTVFPALVCYGLLCVKKGERRLFITRLCLAFVTAILLAMPVLLPALQAYLSSGRTGTLFENFWYGGMLNDANEFVNFNKDNFIKHITGAAYAKFSYIFSDTAFLALTIIWFFRTGLKKPFAKFMLVAGVMTAIPVLFDESMLLMNMGSYMSYALRFGFLNAAYMLGGACLALDGLHYGTNTAYDGTPLKPVKITALSKNEEGETKPQPLCGSLAWIIIFVVVFLAAFFFLLWWISGSNPQNFLRAITDNKEILEGIDDFAGKFAHSLGGMEIIVVPVVVVAILVFFAAILAWRKKMGLRILSYALVLLVGTQIIFYNNALVAGNCSTQHEGLGAYSQLCQTLNEMNTDENGELQHFRVKDYGDDFTATAPFTGNSNSFSVFSSVIDADNFIIGELFGYEGNFKNTLKSAHNYGKANRSDEFGDSFLGYKYFIVESYETGRIEDNKDIKKYLKPLMVKDETGAEVQLSAGGFFVYENTISFPSAFKVDGGEYRFVKPNVSNSTNRAENQKALYEFLRGKTLEDMRAPTGSTSSYYVTPETAGELSKYLWENKATDELHVGAGRISAKVTATEGECLMLSFVASKGYKVFVNGKQTQLVDNDLKFLCVALEEGENEVEFVYTSPYIDDIFIGLAVAVAGVLALYFVVEKTSLLKADDERLLKARVLTTTAVFVLAIVVTVAVVGFFMLFPSAVGIMKWVKYFTP